MNKIKCSNHASVKIERKKRVPRKKMEKMEKNVEVVKELDKLPMDRVARMLNIILELTNEMWNRLCVAEEQLVKLQDVKDVMNLYNQKYYAQGKEEL